MSKLNPCPCCHKVPQFLRDADEYLDHYFIYYLKCECCRVYLNKGPWNEDDSSGALSALKDIWNTRAPIEPSEATIVAAAEVLADHLGVLAPNCGVLDVKASSNRKIQGRAVNLMLTAKAVLTAAPGAPSEDPLLPTVWKDAPPWAKWKAMEL